MVSLSCCETKGSIGNQSRPQEIGTEENERQTEPLKIKTEVDAKKQNVKCGDTYMKRQKGRHYIVSLFSSGA